MADDAVTCCIVGGGPAGAMLGLLLARAGIDVAVLEKHHDFLRDFRGDTIHPSTIAVMDELGLTEAFHALPHQKVDRLQGDVGGTRITVADLSALGGRFPYIMMMPQWDFLAFVTGEAAKYPGFRLLMGAEATGVLREDGRVAGVSYRQDGAARTMRADLTVACDGRFSTVRDALGLAPREFGAPMDVLWFRVPREAGDPDTMAFLGAGLMLVFINRGDYWQTAYVIPKGGYARVRGAGLDAFRESIRGLSRFIDEDRLRRIASWDDVGFLEVRVNRLARWHVPGMLLIGDAAHAMSPVGGVGINLAVQDAVAAANILAGPLKSGAVGEDVLARVQRRRAWPTAATQLVQRIIQRRVVGSAVAGRRAPRVPAWLEWVLARGAVRRATARFIGYGVRPEHVATPAAGGGQASRFDTSIRLSSGSRK